MLMFLQNIEDFFDSEKSKSFENMEILFNWIEYLFARRCDLYTDVDVYTDVCPISL